MKGYCNKEIFEKTGLTPRLIQFYTQEQVVIPEIDSGKGRGRVRRYSEKNLFQFALVKELNDYGIKLSIVKGVINLLTSRKGLDFMESIKIAKPVLSIRKRIIDVEFEDVTPTLTDRSVFETSPELLRRDMSMVLIDLYELYRRKCLGQKVHMVNVGSFANEIQGEIVE
jgi:DNA-binding transcriptional MerR regulator